MRDFSFDVIAMAAEKPLLDTGVYAGEIAAASIKDKEGNYLLSVIEEEKWNKKLGEKEKTGRHVLEGTLRYRITLTSERAKKILMQDEPIVFGQTTLKFDQETGQLSLTNNPMFKQIATLLDINVNELQTGVDMDAVENAVIPEEMLDIPNIKTLWPAVIYYRQFFDLFCEQMASWQVKVKLKKGPNFRDKSITETVLDQGNMNQPFCGMLAYEEGFEHDLT